MVVAEASLAGLVAAASLPLAYARAARTGRSFPAASAAAVGGYFATAAGLWWLPGCGSVGCVVVAGLGVGAACRLGRWVGAGSGQRRVHPGPDRLGLDDRGTVGGAPRCMPSGRSGSPAGPGGAGRFVTFPGMSLAVLVATHIEAGPSTACRTASAMPAGNLGMLAFLTLFRFGCPRLGLAWGTAAGFLGATATLGAIGWASRAVGRRWGLLGSTGGAPSRRRRGPARRGPTTDGRPSAPDATAGRVPPPV